MFIFTKLFSKFARLLFPLLLLVGTRDVRTQSVRAQFVRARVQSVPSFVFNPCPVPSVPMLVPSFVRARARAQFVLVPVPSIGPK
jgi:hypothetical protein